MVFLIISTCLLINLVTALFFNKDDAISIDFLSKLFFQGNRLEKNCIYFFLQIFLVRYILVCIEDWTVTWLINN